MQAASIGPPVPGGHDERVVEVCRDLDIPLQPVGSQGCQVSEGGVRWGAASAADGRRAGCVCTRATARAPSPGHLPHPPTHANARLPAAPAGWPWPLQRRAWEYDEMRDTVDYDLVVVMDQYDRQEVVREVRRPAAGWAGRAAAVAPGGD